MVELLLSIILGFVGALLFFGSALYYTILSSGSRPADAVASEPTLLSACQMRVVETTSWFNHILLQQGCHFLICRGAQSCEEASQRCCAMINALLSTSRTSTVIEPVHGAAAGLPAVPPLVLPRPAAAASDRLPPCTPPPPLLYESPASRRSRDNERTQATPAVSVRSLCLGALPATASDGGPDVLRLPTIGEVSTYAVEWTPPSSERDPIQSEGERGVAAPSGPCIEMLLPIEYSDGCFSVELVSTVPLFFGLSKLRIPPSVASLKCAVVVKRLTFDVKVCLVCTKQHIFIAFDRLPVWDCELHAQLGPSNKSIDGGAKTAELIRLAVSRALSSLTSPHGVKLSVGVNPSNPAVPRLMWERTMLHCSPRVDTETSNACRNDAAAPTARTDESTLCGEKH